MKHMDTRRKSTGPFWQMYHRANTWLRVQDCVEGYLLVNSCSSLCSIVDTVPIAVTGLCAASAWHQVLRHLSAACHTEGKLL